MNTRELLKRKLNRRKLLKAGAGMAFGSAFVSALAAPPIARAAGGKVIIGAFADGGLTPFKQKIIPLAKSEAGFDIQFLEDEYGVTLEKWFADAQNSAGQYDIYLLDDPWVPQFGAADVLEDLGAGGIDASDPDWIASLIAMGYWPPRQGPRVKGYEQATPKLISLPFVGDLQTLTYRNDVYANGAPATWDELIAKGKEGVAAGKIKYPIVFRGVSGNPIVTSWYPISCPSAASSSTTSGTSPSTRMPARPPPTILWARSSRTLLPASSNSIPIRRGPPSSAARPAPSSNIRAML